MIDVTRSITIDRPVAEVFAYVTDVSNDPAWHTDVLEARRTSQGPVAPGTTYHLRFKPFMGVSEGVAEVVSLKPNRLGVIQGEMGPMTPTITYRFEPSEGGTRFTRRVQFELSGVMRLMQPMMRASGGKRSAGFLANLKRVLEQDSPSAAS